MESVFSKHDGSTTKKDCHKIIDIWPMAGRLLVNIHTRIVRRLRASPSVSSFFGHLSSEVPTEVFDVIRKEILERTSWGIETTTSARQVTLQITELRKATFLFERRFA